MAVNFFSRSRCPLSVIESNFAFAFNDKIFSDRVLRLEITADVLETKSKDENQRSLISWIGDGNRKKETTLKENEQDTDDVVGYVDAEEEGAVKIRALVRNTNLLEDEAANCVESNSNASAILQVKDIHINSLVLAAKSMYFYEIFSNVTRESEHRQLTLRIHASEEAALMDLLRFMYNITLSTNSIHGLLDVLIAADKYKVSSCIRYCTMMLLNGLITCESSLIYLDRISSIGMVDEVRPLADAAKKHLVMRFTNFMKYRQDLLEMPLVGIEAVLSSDDLQLPTEDAVYDFLLNWASIHYSKPDERRMIMSTRLCKLMRFHYMPCRKLRNILTCVDIDSWVSHKLVRKALFFKAEPPYKQRALSATADFSVERRYKYHLTKMVEFKSPNPRCIIYLDLKREECAFLLSKRQSYVQLFPLDGKGFFLFAKFIYHCPVNFSSFGLFLGMQDKGCLSSSVSVEYEFSARLSTSQKFSRRYKGKSTFWGQKVVGCDNLFNSAPRKMDFLDEDSVYFIDGVLQLKAEIRIDK